MKKIFIGMAIFFLSFSLFGFEIIQPDFSTFMGNSASNISGILQSAYESSSPRQLNDVVLFMCKPTSDVRYMGIAFSHENFSKIHLFSKQNMGVFYYLYKVTGELDHLDYRIVIDGVWRHDENNSYKIQDNYGHTLSRLELDTSILEEDMRPRVLKNGEVIFRYQGEPGKRVFLNSDICSWDPFVFRMEEIRPGVYEKKIRMTKGLHYYYFIVNGAKLLGNISLDTRIHSIAGEVNHITVE